MSIERLIPVRIVRNEVETPWVLTPIPYIPPERISGPWPCKAYLDYQEKVRRFIENNTDDDWMNNLKGKFETHHCNVKIFIEPKTNRDFQNIVIFYRYYILIEDTTSEFLKDKMDKMPKCPCPPKGRLRVHTNLKHIFT